MQRKSDTPANFDLFADQTPQAGGDEQLGPGTWLLRGFALPVITRLLADLQATVTHSPFRHMLTPGGLSMSAALSSCGQLGWITDRHGYRYSETDPQTGSKWSAMPDAFMQLAQSAALKAGYPGFTPDACLINRYIPGAKMSLHQDKDEHDHRWPVVSVSLGIPAIFQFGGLLRSDKALRISLFHGDVVVWGGEDRLRFHGILPVKQAEHPLLGEQRINLTFRKAGPN
ncbi:MULTISPECIES: DNA oxidative demethylase AlkB [Pseudomonas syringae group]|uniref:DNA oxidative demethylase AlkB n=1 Tax=Pseudomonas syringae group TaxID=136849 RepID=UPI0006D5EED4|nr:DNA oxidative demethylase AlkB [Pseudomonas coronafaciens]RMS91394.1 Alpha-ketoglutarate-dependent dioxygenase AlkB [Pseudomonas coronafaciens pv. oryzae]RMS93360.1 Alpha-ketoglutarate-dependent dioxygenase AlkB [Pseudomonas coronafaciens pv. oryzae]RMV87272.1 Alpha-ketoglutarate-dependent dioxygenase AlkB [Pseudomonas coronafaciens pv. garcae]